MPWVVKDSSFNIEIDFVAFFGLLLPLSDMKMLEERVGPKAERFRSLQLKIVRKKKLPAYRRIFMKPTSRHPVCFTLEIVFDVNFSLNYNLRVLIDDFL